MTDDLTQGTRLGDCELLVRIGRGGMATVWVAKRHAATPEEDRLVAVKVMLPELAEDPAFVSMFRDEVKLIEAIDHPNVVEVLDVGAHQETMYMVMEWVEGDSLHRVIAEAGKRRPIPAEIAVRIIADAAAGLHAAHELRGGEGQLLGVVHRDVSPQNILIGTDGRVKLVDFGVAKAIGRLTENTRAGQVKGKFAYMAPEQVSGGPVDRRADVFALGIVLYELTTNQKAFRGETDIDTLRKVVSGEVTPPSRLVASYPPALEQIVMRALRKDVEARYQTAAELEGALRAYLRQERVVVPRSGIASLLKKVMAARIEQRRRAIRKALHSLGPSAGDGSADGAVAGELISDEPAFTPTGSPGRRQLSSGVSVVTGVSGITGLSVVGDVSIVDAAPSEPVAPGVRGILQTQVRRLERKVGGRGPLIAYVVGGVSLLVGLSLTVSALTRESSAGTEASPTTAGEVRSTLPEAASATSERAVEPSASSEPTPAQRSASSEPTPAQRPEEPPTSPRPVRLEDLDAE